MTYCEISKKSPHPTAKTRAGEAVLQRYWTGGVVNQSRAYDDYVVSYSSASGWYVFNVRTDRIPEDGLGSEENARKLAKRLSGRRKSNAERGVESMVRQWA